MCYRAYIGDYIYEYENMDDLMEAVKADYPDVGMFDVFKVHSPDEGRENDSFYASISVY